MKQAFYSLHSGVKDDKMMLEFLQFFLGKSQWVEICKNGFIGIFGDFEPDNTKVQHEEDGGIVFTILLWQKIKNHRRRNISIPVFVVNCKFKLDTQR